MLRFSFLKNKFDSFIMKLAKSRIISICHKTGHITLVLLEKLLNAHIVHTNPPQHGMYPLGGWIDS